MERMIRGVLMDVDGTLVDSNDAHANAWVEALAEHGHQVAFKQVRKLIGMGGDKLLPRVSGLAEDSPEGQAVSKRRKAIFQERYLPTLRPTPGAADLVRRLRALGLKLAVASSAKADELEGLLRVCEADQLIGHRTSSDDAEQSKPDPDIVHAALEKIGLPAAAVVMLGDTPFDVAAARKAGVAVIALRCGGWGDAELAGAAAVYDDPADLLAHLEALPLAERSAAAGAAG
jgi:HAD superfamily hydrolase (TIGR01509 family)